MSHSPPPLRRLDKRTDETDVEQTLSQYYHAERSATSGHPSFNELWDTARHTNASPTFWHIKGTGLGAGLMSIALCLTALFYSPSPPSSSSSALFTHHHAGLDEEELLGDAHRFDWSDGWLEGDEWSLEWPPLE